MKTRISGGSDGTLKALGLKDGEEEVRLLLTINRIIDASRSDEAVEQKTENLQAGLKRLREILAQSAKSIKCEIKKQDGEIVFTFYELEIKSTPIGNIRG